MLHVSYLLDKVAGTIHQHLPSLGKAKELIWSHQTHGEDNKKDSCSAPFRDKSP
jgi:hypothetical protein